MLLMIGRTRSGYGDGGGGDWIIIRIRIRRWRILLSYMLMMICFVGRALVCNKSVLFSDPPLMQVFDWFMMYNLYHLYFLFRICFADNTLLTYSRTHALYAYTVQSLWLCLQHGSEKTSTYWFIARAERLLLARNLLRASSICLHTCGSTGMNCCTAAHSRHHLKRNGCASIWIPSFTYNNGHLCAIRRARSLWAAKKTEKQQQPITTTTTHAHGEKTTATTTTRNGVTSARMERDAKKRVVVRAPARCSPLQQLIYITHTHVV